MQPLRFCLFALLLLGIAANSIPERFLTTFVVDHNGTVSELNSAVLHFIQGLSGVDAYHTDNITLAVLHMQ